MAFSLMWSMLDSGDIKCSLRSAYPNDSRADVSLIAKAHGGGGHRAASSFVCRGGFGGFEAMLEAAPRSVSSARRMGAELWG